MPYGALAPVALWERMFTRLASAAGPFVRGGETESRQMFTASVLVYGLLELGEFPTEPVTSEAHPYSPQARARRRFRYRLPVQGHAVEVFGQRLQQCSFRSS
ncbi:hypothetical protein Taro_016474, partial [Colocasia esculenta]|nr:hypothetical protein [Colocasia esculenta]